MAKRICSAVLVFAILLLCGISVSTPPQNLYTYCHTDEDIVKTLKSEDIVGFNSCGAEGNRIKITDGDAGIIFEVQDIAFRSVRINVDKKEKSVPVQIFVDEGAGYVYNQSPYAHILSGNSSVSLNVKGENAKFLRIDIDEDYTLNSVELHQKEAKKNEYTPKTPYFLYGITVVLALLLTLVFALLDRRFAITEKITENFKKGGKAFAFNFEKSVFCLVLILGVCFAVARPFGHVAWDFDSHYRMALCSSYGGTVYVTEADRKCMNAHADSLISATAEENASKIEAMNDSAQILSSVERGRPRLTHFSMGVPMAIARFFGVDFYGQVLAGRLGNVILYAVLCYFALKKLKSGKVLMSVIAMLPTNLFLAASYSYDTWVTGFAFLGMAYFISELQQPEKRIECKDTVIMCLAFAVACIPKAIYAPLILLPLFMSKREFGNRKSYYRLYLLILAVLALFFVLMSLTVISGTGDLRGGAVNPKEQITFILSNPFNYVKILFGFLKGYLSPVNAGEYMLHFGYAGIGAGKWILVAVMLAATLTDSHINHNFRIRVSSIGVFAVTVVLIATSMYVAFTPVKYEVINGCQPRYLIPLLFPLLSVWGIKGVYIKRNRWIYNALMIAPVILVNLYNVYHIFTLGI